MKKIFLLMMLMVFASAFGYELNTLIDSPTAGILQKGEVEISAKLYKDNGLLLGTRIGLFPRFNIGVNYGAERIVGNQNPVWHERVEFNCKIRFLDETAQLPAMAIGYDSQGHGNYYKDQKRYDIKSKGVYFAASKNYFFLGNLGFHLGANYSLETEYEEGLNLFAGIDKSLGDMIVIMAEYDTAWNDNKGAFQDLNNIDIQGVGFLNASVDIHFTEYLILKISFYDLLENRTDTEGCDRTLTLLYNMTF
ncbi:MAG: YjbH domain-containing protein [Candidatus Cloacimonetes bacterium]|nr:YjbH domain-containing protein [Candidatus Cloacimonadota bacterium]MCF7814236.1 YjbH domain-containing protein [Candidatus Cloacimonadota bacterium]MCF7868443.1 YjbH domain-containing protein [Candidatus Cloacimonadota bacterium]MCF7883937.1 YjbH domain-containing protein [Candidatus Cloacimonadota bacterium]